MATHNIYLTLSGRTLKWSPDKKNWQVVTQNSPSTVVKRKDDVNWISDDDTIAKIKVQFSDHKVFNSISDDDSKRPFGKVKDDALADASDKYTIYVKPGTGTGYIAFDPDVKVSNPPD